MPGEKSRSKEEQRQGLAEGRNWVGGPGRKGEVWVEGGEFMESQQHKASV